MIRKGLMKLDTTRQFNFPKRVRCNICGRYVSRGILNQAEHQYENHTLTVEWNPITEQDIRDIIQEMNGQ